MAPLQDIRLHNLGDLEFGLKFNGAVGLPIYDFLLVSNSNYMSNMSNSHRLGVIATGKCFSYLLCERLTPYH